MAHTMSGGLVHQNVDEILKCCAKYKEELGDDKRIVLAGMANLTFSKHFIQLPLTYINK
jgi:sporulation-control protein spo0M